MRWYKRLRYRLVGLQLIVVIVGVLSMLLILWLLIPAQLHQLIDSQLRPLGLPAETLTAVESSLIDSVNQLLLTALLFASLASLLVGVIYALILWIIIITPLRNMATSSQRIADGRYDERVAVPTEAGEAMAQLATNFNQMASKLEKTEETRLTLIGNVAHELRTPLSSLSGYVEGMTDGIFQPDERLFNSMARQIGRLARLVDDIQALSRAEAGEIALDPVRFYPYEIIQQLLFQLKPKLLDKKVDITISRSEAEPVEMMADYDRVSQILINLLSNAIRHTPEGGHIEVSTGVEPSSSLSLGTIEVIDSGSGISPEVLPMVFERFYRGDRSRSRSRLDEGSGVGLTISRHLARAMGGELIAHSDGIGQGSRFTLLLPLASPS
ncbi:MAG: HAMP domain-containing sensor histidine kinase [Chloroflexota bacterium]